MTRLNGTAATVLVLPAFPRESGGSAPILRLRDLLCLFEPALLQADHPRAKLFAHSVIDARSILSCVQVLIAVSLLTCSCNLSLGLHMPSGHQIASLDCMRINKAINSEHAIWAPSMLRAQDPDR